MDSIAVLDFVQDEVTIWTVFVGSRQTNPFSRMTGAWVLSPSQLLELHIWSSVSSVVWLGSPPRPIDSELPAHLKTRTLEGLFDDVSREIIRLESVYETQKSVSGPKIKMVPPRWPTIMPAKSQQELATNTTESKERVLNAARWIANTADSWAQIEEIRLARTYMREESGSIPRPIPWLS